MPRPLLLWALLLCCPARAQAPRAPLSLSALPAPAELATLLWERSPRLQAARLRLAEAGGELQSARLLPNPAFDVSWNTVPLGETNPPGLARPLEDVPNYTFGVSQLVELGKRGPRQGAAENARLAAVEDARAALFEVSFDAQERIAAVATAQLRIAEWSELAEGAGRLTALQRARAQKGDVAALDADRADLEEESFRGVLGQEQARLAAALRACGELVGAPCQPFADRASAAAFMAPRVLGEEQAVGERPDLRSLALQEAAARQALALAHARAVPDPTLRVGYVHDRFVAAGNQVNSLFVGVSLPLPVFDRGQAQAQVAGASLAVAARTRSLLLEQAGPALAKLAEERATVGERQERLRTKTLPLARSVVTRLEDIVRRGGAPLPELLLARRTLGALTADAADLDLAAFSLAIAEARLRGAGPPLPPSLLHSP